MQDQLANAQAAAAAAAASPHARKGPATAEAAVQSPFKENLEAAATQTDQHGVGGFTCEAGSCLEAPPNSKSWDYLSLGEQFRGRNNGQRCQVGTRTCH